MIETTHYLKYLDQFLMVLLETFTIGLIFAGQSKQEAATLYVLIELTHYLKYLDQFLMDSHFWKTIETRGCNPMFQPELHISCLTKMSLVVKVASKTIKNWSKYLW